jgi:hypothetical protein
VASEPPDEAYLGGGPWELFEVLGAAVLVALSLRIVGSIVSGSVLLVTYRSTNPIGFGVAEVGQALEWFGGFGEISGIPFLLGLIALLWWRVVYWSQIGVNGDENSDWEYVRRLHRLSWQCRWAYGIAVLTIFGAVAILAGVIFTQASVPWSSQGYSTITQGAFQLASIVLVVCGAVAARILVLKCEHNLYGDDWSDEDASSTVSDVE